MFWGVISLLSTVLSAFISSAAPQPADRGTNLVLQSPPAQLAAATDRASIEAPVANVLQVNTATTTSNAAQCDFLPRTAGPTNAGHAAGASGGSHTSVGSAAPPALPGDQVMTAFGPDRISTEVLYAPAASDNAGFRAVLAALLQINVDYFDARVATPTLEQLAPYAAVITWVNNPYADPVAMGDVLADFVAGCRKVILGQWCRHSDQNNYLSGRIMDEPGYCPVLACSTSLGSGSYNMDGVSCAHYGPFGSVGAHSASYLDVVSAVSPTAFTDGTIDGSISAVTELPGYVWYAPGFTGLSYGGGDWVTKIANMVACYYPCGGACCFAETGVCHDDMIPCDCISSGGRFLADLRCAELSPRCGDPGACCDVHTGACVDEVLAAVCESIGHQAHTGVQCGELEPACGDPGCCCDFAEGGGDDRPYFDFRANCQGRFISGEYPLCGDLDQNGVVDMSDYNLFLDAFGSCPGAPGVDPGADLDRDGCVTLADFQIWRNCYQFQGTGCTRDSFDPPCGWGLLDYLFGTDAPPSSLCGLEMSPFPPDEAAAYGPEHPPGAVPGSE